MQCTDLSTIKAQGCVRPPGNSREMPEVIHSHRKALAPTLTFSSYQLRILILRSYTIECNAE